jgi:hypothetical protein
MDSNVAVVYPLMRGFSFITLGAEGEASMTFSRQGNPSCSCDFDCLSQDSIHVSDFGGENCKCL